MGAPSGIGFAAGGSLLAACPVPAAKPAKDTVRNAGRTMLNFTDVLSRLAWFAIDPRTAQNWAVDTDQ